MELGVLGIPCVYCWLPVVPEDLRVSLGGYVDGHTIDVDGLIPFMQRKTKGNQGLWVLSTGTVFLLRSVPLLQLVRWNEDKSVSGHIWFLLIERGREDVNLPLSLLFLVLLTFLFSAFALCSHCQISLQLLFCSLSHFSSLPSP